MARVSLVAFEDRPGGFIFVAVPTQRGRYVRTHRCVAVVACSRCRATAGEPCKTDGGDGYHSFPHCARTSEYKRLPRERRREIADMVDPQEDAIEERAE